jgi:hypothetical protein
MLTAIQTGVGELKTGIANDGNVKTGGGISGGKSSKKSSDKNKKTKKNVREDLYLI